MLLPPEQISKLVCLLADSPTSLLRSFEMDYGTHKYYYFVAMYR